MRAVLLNADPPAGTLSSCGVFRTDEGWYTHNAVNRILIGKWVIPADFNPMSHIPLCTLIEFIVFRILGISFTSARLIGVMASLLTIYLLFFVLRRSFSTGFALIGASLLGFKRDSARVGTCWWVYG